MGWSPGPGATEGPDEWIGTDADERHVHGLGGNDILRGLGGDDYLLGFEGNDTLEGGDGVDELKGGVGNDTISAGAGDDVSIYGEFGHDIIHGDDGNDILSGGSDNDTLFGGAGDDIVYGNSGNPHFSTDYPEISDDTLDGGDGTDILISGRGNDTLIGGQGDDILVGSKAYFDLSGQLNVESNGVFAGFTMVFEGGDGFDIAYMRFSHNDVPLRLTVLDVNAVSPIRYSNVVRGSVTGVEQFNIHGTSGGDIIDLSGTSGNNFIWGSGGNDRLTGGSGNDHIEATGVDDIVIAGGGDDLVMGGTFSDVFDGGDGVDTLHLFANVNYQVDMNVGTYSAFIVTGLVYSGTFTGFENVRTSDGDDSIFGNAGANVIDGQRGGDTIYGRGGADILNGGDDNDVIYAYDVTGGDDDDGDILNGGLGDDILHGAGGNDQLFSGSGFDALYADGSGFRLNSRFNKFTNLPELAALWRQAPDVKNADQLNLPRPKIAGGAPQVITIPASPELKQFVKSLAARVEAIKSRLVPPEVDNMLRITTDGRKAALDIRLVMPDAPRPAYSKVEAVADKIVELYKQSQHLRGAQAVFSDCSVPKGKGR